MGEFNVMIADKAYRRHGYGYYTVILVMMWAVRYAKLKEFFVKIKKNNTPSIKMFEKIGFTFYRYNRHFDENEYRIKVTNELSKKWFQEIGFPLKMYAVASNKQTPFHIKAAIVHLPSASKIACSSPPRSLYSTARCSPSRPSCT